MNSDKCTPLITHREKIQAQIEPIIQALEKRLGGRLKETFQVPFATFRVCIQPEAMMISTITASATMTFMSNFFQQWKWKGN